jgi:transmembrane sensor
MPTPAGPAGSDEDVRKAAIAWLTRLQAGGDASDHDAFLDWYSADPRNAEIYDALLNSWDQMEAVARTPAGQVHKGNKRAWSLPGAGMMALVGVGLLLALGLSVFIMRQTDQAAIQPSALKSWRSRTGEIIAFALSDGSRITLDTDSAVTMAYDRSERRIMLTRGRARFEVAHDAARPFIVSAGRYEIVAHGTVFDIDVSPRRPQVSLLRGSIEIRSHDHPQVGRFLEPGQRLSLARNAGPQAPVVLPIAESRWPSGMLSFSDAPMVDVIKAANLYAQRAVVLGEPDLGELRFTGTFRANDTASLAALLAETFQLVVDRDAGGHFVLRRPTSKKIMPG